MLDIATDIVQRSMCVYKVEARAYITNVFECMIIIYSIVQVHTYITWDKMEANEQAQGPPELYTYSQHFISRAKVVTARFHRPSPQLRV